MLASLALIIAAPQQSAVLTYQTHAKRLDLVVAELADLSGMKLETGTDAQNHYLVIAVTNAPTQETLNRIADVTDSKWITGRDDLRKLVPDLDLREKQAQKELEARTRRIEEEWASLIVRTVTGDTHPRNDNALTRLAKHVGLAELAKVKVGERVVWSLTPTQTQRQLEPSEAVDWAISEAVQQNNQMVANPMNEREHSDAFSEAASLLGVVPEPFMAIIEPPAEALFIVERLSIALTVQLELYDETGRLLMHRGDTPLIDEYYPPTPEPINAPVPEDELAEIQWSERSLAWSKVSAWPMDYDAPGIFEAIGDPVAVEPLALAPSDALLAIAEAKGLGLVANVADDLEFGWTGGPMTVHIALGILRKEAKVATEDGWMTVRPSNPAEARDRFSREALRRLVVSYQQKDSLSLDEIAEYAATEREPESPPRLSLYASYFMPSLMRRLRGSQLDWEVLRLWGRLPAAQRSALRRGGSVLIGYIPPNAREALASMLFGIDHRLTSRSAAQARSQNILIPAYPYILGVSRAGTGDMRSEPTEAMPNGLPSNGTIECRPVRGFYARPAPHESNAAQALGDLGPALFARYEEEIEERQGMARYAGSMERFLLGERETLHLTFFVARDSATVRTLVYDTPPGGEIIARDELPAAFLASVNATKAAIKESPFVSLMNAQRGGSAPPSSDPPH